jgi:hypothetical protein
LGILAKTLLVKNTLEGRGHIAKVVFSNSIWLTLKIKSGEGNYQLEPQLSAHMCDMIFSSLICGWLRPQYSTALCVYVTHGHTHDLL